MLKWKWILIAGVTLGSVAAALPLQKRIRLGLDLKGGIHLVVKVETDDAIRAELDDAVNRLRLRLDDKKVPYKSVERVMDPEAGVYRVVVQGLAEGDAMERGRKVMESTLREYKRDSATGELTAELQLSHIAGIRDTTVEQAKTTIEERVNATGVAEPVIQRQGLRGERILIQLPGMEDPEHVKRLIGQVAFLELKIVASVSKVREEAIKAVTPGQEVLEGVDDDANPVYYVVDRIPVITGRDLTRAVADSDEFNQAAVGFTLNADGAKKFGDATSKNIGRQLAIILDGRVKSAPSIRSKITDRGQVTNIGTKQEARDLALVLRAGALPAKISYLEERTVGPFLGADSIRKGVYSGTVGLIIIIIFMVAYYRLSGLNAVVALLLNAVLLLGALGGLRAILTLPGIAGFILTLGMAVDANVLIYEAIRENIRLGLPPKRAIEQGFERAFSTIIDSNLTTMLAALALWMLGSGPVRGFGVTLFIGLLVSLFTSFYVSKTIFETFVLRREWKSGETVSI